MIKNGFGYIGKTLSGTGAASEERNLVVALIGLNEQRIYSITASYGEVDPTAPIFKGGRLIVLEGELQNAEKLQILVSSDANLNTSDNRIVHDVFINSTSPFHVGFGGTGLVIPAGKKGTVILVAPVNSAAAPAFAATPMKLTVQGEETALANAFPKLR